uniref:Protein kinase domain-containing protein n=2 Tax=Ascaris TaxID=6251 RepID=A0A0M3IL87_ASCLU
MLAKAVLPSTGQNVELKGKLYNIDSELYDGPFSKVYTVSENGTQFAMKIERTVGPTRPVLKLDALVLKQLNSERTAIGFPRLIAAGRTSLYKYVIMELVGPDLQRLRRALPAKRFSLSTALRVGGQTLDRIQSLHDCGWLCRDIKANNFCIGRDDTAVIFMLDFGFARRYMRNDGVIIGKRTAAGLMGTIFYAPLAAHAFSDQCRRDDLESWFYMLIEITTGSLPWQRCDPKTQYMLIGEWKRFAREAGRYLLLEGCPYEYDSILKTIDETGYYARPDYNGIAAYLKQASIRLKIDPASPFDWQVNERIICKSEFIGEKGESNMASEKLNRHLEKGEAIGNYAMHEGAECAMESDNIPM